MKMEDSIFFGCAMLASAMKSNSRNSVVRMLPPPKEIPTQKMLEAHKEMCKLFDEQEENLKKGNGFEEALQFLKDYYYSMVEYGFHYSLEIRENLKFRAKILLNLMYSYFPQCP